MGAGRRAVGITINFPATQAPGRASGYAVCGVLQGNDSQVSALCWGRRRDYGGTGGRAAQCEPLWTFSGDVLPDWKNGSVFMSFAWAIQLQCRFRETIPDRKKNLNLRMRKTRRWLTATMRGKAVPVNLPPLETEGSCFLSKRRMIDSHHGENKLGEL